MGVGAGLYMYDVVVKSSLSLCKLMIYEYVVCSPDCNIYSSAWLKPRFHDTTCCQTELTTGCIVYTAGCQSVCTTRFDNRLNEQWLFVKNG